MGTVMQIYGNFLANTINFYMSDKPYKTVNDNNYNLNIIGVSPFSICGTVDHELIKYTKCEQTNIRVKVDLLKNFDELIKKSYADYIIVDNTSALIHLNKINNQFYSMIDGEKTDFMDDFYNNNVEIKKKCIKPYITGLNRELRKQYDLFIETIIRYYDSSNIILISSHLSRFYNNNENIFFSNISSNIRYFLKELDEYFISKTKCAVIKTTERFYQLNDSIHNLKFEKKFQFTLENDIIALCETEIDFKKKISSNYLECLRNYNKNISSEIFQSDVSELHFYLKEKSDIIADYIIKNNYMKIDFSLILKYFRRINYALDDIIALFWLYDNTVNKSPFKSIALEILSNKEGLAYKYTKELFEKNKSILLKYEYCMINDINEIQFEEQIIVRFSDRLYFKISSNGDFEKIKFFPTKKTEWNYKKFIKNQYACGIEEIEDSLSSCALYFERARKNDLKPLKLSFNNRNEFINTLYYIDYDEILNNENYCIVLPESSEPENYIPKVDLSFLFKKETRIFHFADGFADQIHYYLYPNKYAEENKNTIYFFDLFYDYRLAFNGIEIQKFIGTKIFELKKHYFFRNLISKKMRLQIEEKKVESIYKYHRTFPIILFLLGLNELFLLLKKSEFSGKRHEILSSNIPCDFGFSENKKISFDISINNKSTIFYTGINKLLDISYKQFMEENCFFPPITDEKNLKIQQKMLDTDAYVIHIRRGDFIKLGWDKDIDYYKNHIKTSFNILKYTNKHLFVFSDDIDWVYENSENMQFNLFGDNITYINHNHHYNSFRDMQLMTYGKVIIPSGTSGFSNTAAIASRRVEYIFGGVCVPQNKTFLKRKILSDGTLTYNFTSK